MPFSVRNYTGLSGSGKARALVFSPWVVVGLFVLAALALYWPTRNAGFVMDWLGWQYAYNRDGWAGVPGSFGYQGLHPVLHLGNYTLYWLFGANSPVWYVVFAALHGGNAALLFRLTLRLPAGLSPGNSLATAGLAAALFLLSPYAAEVVVWRVCLHYLLALTFALLAMHRTLDYLADPGRRYWWQIQALVLAALFTFEWSLVIPVLLFSLALAHGAVQKTQQPFGRLLGRLFVPQVALWGVYFGLNKLRIGDWVGHYGAETHLNLDPQPMLANVLRYSVKQFAFVRHWAHPAKTAVFEGLAGGTSFWVGTGALALLAVLWLVFFRRLNPALQWAGAAFAWFLIALLPVSNLFFYYLQYSENDRYGYFASGFGWLAVALILSRLPKIPARLLALGWIALSLHLLLSTNDYWAKSEKMYDNLVADFRWYDRDEVIILGSPDNYRGVFMFRIIGQINGFNEALELRRGEPYRGNMWEVAQYNVVNPTDSLRVEQDSTGLHYKVSFGQDGNWWWRNGIGATDYENDRYVFQKKEWHMEVDLKEKRPNTAVIYPVGDQWVEVGFGQD